MRCQHALTQLRQHCTFLFQPFRLKALVCILSGIPTRIIARNRQQRRSRLSMLLLPIPFQTLQIEVGINAVSWHRDQLQTTTCSIKCIIDTASYTPLCFPLVVCKQARHVQQRSESLQRSDGSECVHGFNEYQETYWKSKKPWLDPLVLWLQGLTKVFSIQSRHGQPKPKTPHPVLGPRLSPPGRVCV